VYILPLRAVLRGIYLHLLRQPLVQLARRIADMKFAQPQIGTEIAPILLPASSSDANQQPPVQCTGELLSILKREHPRSYPMLQTVCGHLGRFFNLPGDQISFDMIENRKRGFRPYLESRRYSENSIRTYVSMQRKLLKFAMKHGWHPMGTPSDAWTELLAIARDERLTDITRHFAKTTNSPKEVTKEAVDQWGSCRLKDGLLFTTVAAKKNTFWRLLVKHGWFEEIPSHLVKFSYYGIPLAEMPKKLREEIQMVLKWKQAPLARNRPKFGRIRSVTARGHRLTYQQLTSYAVNVAGASPESLSDLLQPDLIEGFVEWKLNDRQVKTATVFGQLAQIMATVSYHPLFSGQDFTWIKTLMDSLPIEDPSERKKRKTSKFVSYEELEKIPDLIHEKLESCQRKRHKDPLKEALLFQDELIFRWYLYFPWRQRNLRECKVSGSSPNLYKAPLAAYSCIDKPQWIVDAESQDRAASFWQISFSPDGTKTHIPIDLFVPRSLVPYLEKFLEEYRPLLVHGNDPGNLFLTAFGKPLRTDKVGKIVGQWTTLFASNRTTPHLIRDAVAYRWLKEHPQDYLTLSKILWHKNVQTTINHYGARFNESSGICAMETWRDQRNASQN